MGTLCTHEGWIWVKMKPIITQNVKYLRNQWRYLDETFCALFLWCGCKIVRVTWGWHKDHGCHALFSEGSGTFKHVTKNPTKNQNFSKILFASFHMMQEASERYIKHFSTCNIKGAEKNSWSFPVHLFQVSLFNSTLITCQFYCRVDVRAAAFSVPPQQLITCDGGIVEMGAEIQYGK